MYKHRKLMSLVLAILTLAGVFSCAVPVWAADYSGYLDAKAYNEKLLTETVKNENEKAGIVSEITEKREEYAKTYKRADGTYVAVLSQTPLHTLKNGEWVEIDNTLEARGDKLINADGVFDIEFPKVISGGKKITVSNSGEKIAFSVKEIGSATASVSKNEKAEGNLIECDLQKNISGITYENVRAYTDLQYVVSSSFVKENIIINDKEGIKESYSFEIEKGGLDVVWENDGHVEFKDSNKKTVFEIPAPIMTDSSGGVSNDIEVSILNAESSVLTLTYTPSKEWLFSEEREYPVTIDPVIVLPSSKEIVLEDVQLFNNSTEPESVNTNYINSPFGIVADSYTSGEETISGEILVKLNMAAFEGYRLPGVAVTDVNYVVSGSVTGGNILAKTVNGSWNASEITYADVHPTGEGQPVITYGDTFDYFTGSAVSGNEMATVTFNITELFNKWLSGELANNGFVLVPENSSVYGLMIMGGHVGSEENGQNVNSYCIVEYVDTAGNNSDFDCLTQEIGRAGTACVNTFTRALSLSRSDLSVYGLKIPAEIAFNYNPALCNFINIYTELFEVLDEQQYSLLMPYGNNWLPSYVQFLFTVDENEYMYFSGDGTLVTFKLKEEETVNGDKTVTEYSFVADETNDGKYELELIEQANGIEYGNMKLTISDGKTVYFTENGFAEKVCQESQNGDGTYNTLTVATKEPNEEQGEEAFFTIDYVTDGSGKKYEFNYNVETGLLSEITCLTPEGLQIKAGSTDNDLKIMYSYDNARNLTRVTYPDGKYASYEYDSNGYLVKAKNIDGYSIEYTYDSYGKVISFAEFAGNNSGNKVGLLQLGNNMVKVTDAYSGTKIYQFGKDGRLHYIFDDKGNYEKTEYAVSGDENVYSIGTQKILPENLLKNSSFEMSSVLNFGKAKYWSTEYGIAEKPSEQTNMNSETVGCCSDNFGEKVCFISENEKTTEFIYQTVSVTECCSYTFSVFVKSKTPGELSLKITGTDASGNNENENVIKVTSTIGWERHSVTFTPTVNFIPEEITVSIGFNESCGEYYVDCAQLEKGFGVAEYNLLENGAFNNFDEFWTEAEIINNTLYGKQINSVTLDGGLPYYTQDSEEYILNDSISAITQTVKLKGKKGDIYSLGGWFKGAFADNSFPESFMPTFSDTTEQLTVSAAQLKATYSYTEIAKDEEGNETENIVTENFAVSFEPNNSSWQYAVDSFALKGDTESIDITVVAKNIPHSCFVSGIALTLDSLSVSHVDGGGSEEIVAEDPSLETEIEVECPCEECEEFECSCRCVSQDACNCIQCKRRTDIEIVSDNGKIVTNKSFDGENYLNSSVTYSEDFNSVASTTDTNGVVTGFSYNVDGSVASIVKGANSAFEYQVNPMGYISLLSSGVTGLSDNALRAEISCVYDGDKLNSVSEGDVEYTYIYDCWSQLKKVIIDGKTLVSYNYGNGVYRSRILSIVFGASENEGFTVKYTYNLNGDVTRVEKYRVVDGEKDSVVYTYKYDNLGNIDYIKDSATGHFYDYTDNGVVIKNGENGSVIYKTEAVEPDESEESPSYVIRETANNISYENTVYESEYDSASGKTTECEAISVVSQNAESSKTLGIKSVSDWFGRVSGVTVMTKDPTISIENYASVDTSYSYKTVEGVTTGLVTAMDNTVTGDETNSVNYRYTYDSNGRMLLASVVSDISSLNSSCSYLYDEVGQLVMETVGLKAYRYAYDSKGNITSRKAFYGETLLSNDTFTYNATEWEDKLTAYGGNVISYDSIGNTTSYLGAVLAWRGRELSSYNKGTKNISYSYDVDGMRYKKVVKNSNTVAATYDYVYSDEKLVLLTYTENGASTSARFVYDLAGEVRGFILNDSTVYMYIKNAQGDVTAVVNENGVIVIRYTYNAWGETEYTVPSGVDPADTVLITKVSPFAYRGYCYDFDVGLYYLQSRYYDPRLCRFINADSTEYLGTTGTPFSYNLFAYCENDPVNCVDPKGCYYSNKKAVAYAKNWWNARNVDYYSYFTGGDCANFVSQCLYAGGYKMQLGVWSSQVSVSSKSNWDRQYRIAYYSYSNYYGYYIPIFKYFWYKVTYKWRSAPGLFDYLKNNKKLVCYKIESKLRLKAYIKDNKIRVGDVAFFASSKKGIYHAVIIGKLKRTSEYNAYYYAHTTDRSAEECFKSNKHGLLSCINSEKGEYIYVVCMR